MDRMFVEVDLTVGSITEKHGDLPDSLYEFEREFLSSLDGNELVFFFSGSTLRVSFISPRNKRRVEATTTSLISLRASELGLSAICFKGSAHRLSFVDILADKREINPCEQFRFSSPLEFSRILISREGDGTLAIGKAGEKYSPLASVVVDSSFMFGHGGLGAVLGSMNLKGICISSGRTTTLEKGKINEKSRLQKRIKRDGDLALVPEAFRNGWAPVKNFSGRKDPRVVHLSGESFGRCFPGNTLDTPFADMFSALQLGANLGFYDPVTVQTLFEGCMALGLDAAEVGVVLAHVKALKKVEYPLPDISHAELEDLLLLLDQVSGRGGAGEELNSLAIQMTGEHAFLPLCDLRGSLMMAISYALGDSYPAYADLAFGLSHRFSSEHVGLMYAYFRAYTLALLELGVDPEIKIVALAERLFRYVPPSGFLIRKFLLHCSFGKLKGRDLIRSVIAKMSCETLEEIPPFFTENIGENDYTDEIREKELSGSYLREVDMLLRKYGKRSK